MPVAIGWGVWRKASVLDMGSQTRYERSWAKADQERGFVAYNEILQNGQERIELRGEMA